MRASCEPVLQNLDIADIVRDRDISPVMRGTTCVPHDMPTHDSLVSPLLKSSGCARNFQDNQFSQPVMSFISMFQEVPSN